jgi:hypothetical protein
MIMERSGHYSKEELRSYERTSTKQVKSLCDTLTASVAPENPSINNSFNEAQAMVNVFTSSNGNICTTSMPTDEVPKDKKMSEKPAEVPKLMKPLSLQQPLVVLSISILTLNNRVTFW